MGSWYEAVAPIGGRDWFDHAAEESTHLPLLMAPATNGARNSPSKLVDIFNNIETDLILPSEPETCIGSSHGWLILFDSETSRIIIQNPCTKSKIRLPLLVGDTTIIHKAILSGNPSTTPKESCIAMIIFGKDRKLAYVRREKKSWTVIEDAGSFFEDVIYYSNKFFAVEDCGRVVSIGFRQSNSPKVNEITKPWFFRGLKTYLAGTPWGLSLIIRNLDNGGTCRTAKFEVYDLPLLGSEWKMAFDLSGRMLFLGQNHTVSLRTTPDTEFRKDCIFFIDDVDGEQVVGCFDMETQTDIPLSWCSGQSRKTMSVRPTWVIHEYS